ncbi:nucleoside-diphosphate sugar epimerase/dehydratase [Gilvimarinus sp. SDUM040013]|uniref:Nucleoside-diphosphate sugar epimerase/dehydratase n=2 Tax=Gilvimarinus gilvus TaxID=3058038 RepID=A0ABU4RU20_9GAMM|nr:nucleoside-diphosphate sugar epimerase/dehydratase [Gilvimarinus sp. SDUM040013]MDX6848384.1 nucleoside-diphosphate sugar epimerase/dehydratase [Gilvimarinus sp. SDUM040013]
MLKALFESSRTTKRLISLAYDTLAITFALYISICLRLGTLDIPLTQREFGTLAITIVFTLAAFIKMGMYRAILRYMTPQALNTVFLGSCFSALTLAVGSFYTHSFIPRSVPFIYLTVSLILLGGPRLLVHHIAMLLNGTRVGNREPVVVYGAGYTGHQLRLALKATNYKVVAFVDDDLARQGSVFANIKVQSPYQLPEIIKKSNATRVLLALGNTPHSRRAQIIKRLEPLGVTVQTAPAIPDLISGRARIEHIRDVDIEDLLGRDPVKANSELLSACIANKVVMVTGSGGSIGSELCRQIIQQAPKRIVLFELNEYSLYRLESELKNIAKKKHIDVEIVPLLGSVQREHRVETIMKTFSVQTVYHAAAYKHVPLVEHNIVEGVRNNVYGTWYTAEAAIRAGVESFVLISTDKAVRPTNIMGASKRMAELVLQGLSQRQSSTRFTMVRFGNVLGSSGSVVPLFRQQIKAGGPVTVTHPEIIRYFMTIPEAAELVIQAGSMGTGGDVLVLDMGEPVKIDDLAKRMIHLSGLTVKSDIEPDGDIEVAYTGLRPGEKLYEELLIGDNVSGTDHDRIMRAEEYCLTWTETQAILDELDTACHDYSCDKVRELLMIAPTGYTTQEELGDAVWLHKSRSAPLRVVK